MCGAVWDNGETVCMLLPLVLFQNLDFGANFTVGDFNTTWAPVLTATRGNIAAFASPVAVRTYR